MSNAITSICLSVALAVATAFLSGCGGSQTQDAAAGSKPASEVHGHDHGHKH